MSFSKLQFTPSAGTGTGNYFVPGTVTTQVGSQPSIVALPPVDGTNVAALVTNNASVPVSIAWGLTSFPSPTLFNTPGCLMLSAGATILLTGSQAAAVASAAMQMLPPTGGSVTFTRGTASPILIFDAPNVESRGAPNQ